MRRKRSVVAVSVMILALAGMINIVTARAAGTYSLNWWTVDGGGGTLAGNGYVLKGTAGQPEVSDQRESNYRLVGGFWGFGEGSGSPSNSVYLPIVVRAP